MMRLASDVVRLSSRNSMGTFVRPIRFSTNDFTLAACWPIPPSIARGSPATTTPTSFFSIISAMAAISWFLSRRSMIVNGVAKMPRVSLRATPILLSPMSSPRTRVIVPLELQFSLTEGRDEGIETTPHLNPLPQGARRFVRNICRASFPSSSCNPFPLRAEGWDEGETNAFAPL